MLNGLKSKWARQSAVANRRLMLERARNPIVWHRRKWCWPHRNHPAHWSLFRAEYGEIAVRRMRPPGWIAEQQFVRQLASKFKGDSHRN